MSFTFGNITNKILTNICAVVTKGLHFIVGEIFNTKIANNFSGHIDNTAFIYLMCFATNILIQLKIFLSQYVKRVFSIHTPVTFSFQNTFIPIKDNY